MNRMNIMEVADQAVIAKAKKILSKKANVVLKLIEAMQGEVCIFM